MLSVFFVCIYLIISKIKLIVVFILTGVSNIKKHKIFWKI